ncbi:metallophosphoesterase [Anaerovoracaceae bacterium 41-7]|nr:MULTISPECIES: metallophosphoesterase [Clostridia]NCE98581.1 phosphoesterase [Emergencia sp. 1XD21-10]
MNEIKVKRRRKHHGCLHFILYCLILAGIWYYGTFTLTTTEVTIESEKIQDEVTIVQITDLHGWKFGEDNKWLIEAVKTAKPDFIVSTGDMFSAGDSRGAEVAEQLLSDLAEEYPVYAVNGEHDNDSEFEERLSKAGVEVIRYESRDIEIGKTSLRLYGIDNVYYSDAFDLHNEFTLDESRYNILAAHISNSKAFSDFGVDLAMCGDTHGGQVRLPFVGGLNNRGTWFPELAGGEPFYTKGLYEMDAMKLFICGGLGSSPVPVRFLNRPEIAVIHLTPGD